MKMTYEDRKELALLTNKKNGDLLKLSAWFMLAILNTIIQKEVFKLELWSLICSTIALFFMALVLFTFVELQIVQKHLIIENLKK